MRPTFIALLAAAGLVAAAPASASSILAPPNGQYLGSTTTHHFMVFNQVDYDKITSFRVNGHVIMHSMKLILGPGTYGHFSKTANGYHVWGAYSGVSYGHVHGGYAFNDSHGRRHTVQWGAKADGF